jgi:hypothetical protein
MEGASPVLIPRFAKYYYQIIFIGRPTVAPSDHSPLQSAQLASWWHAYEAVLQEDDELQLFRRVEVAEAAILTHREALEKICAGQDEYRVVEEALSKLRVLKRERLRFR